RIILDISLVDIVAPRFAPRRLHLRIHEPYESRRFSPSLIWPHSKSMHRNGLGDLVFPTVQYLSHRRMSPLACHRPFYLARAGGCKSKTWMEGLRFLAIAPLLVRLEHVASVIINANHSIMRPTACVA